MNDAANTISEVVIVMSSATDSPKVLSAIADAYEIPADKVSLIPSDKKASETLKPLLIGRTKTDVSSMLFIATEGSPNSYVKQFNTFADKLGVDVKFDFDDVKLNDLSSEQISEWALEGTYTDDDSLGDIDDLFLSDDDEDQDDDVIGDDLLIQDDDEGGSEESARTPSTKKSGEDIEDFIDVTPISVSSDDGDVSVAAHHDDDPIDMDSPVSEPPQSRGPIPLHKSPSSPAPEADENWTPSEPEPQGLQGDDDEDDFLDLPGMSPQSQAQAKPSAPLSSREQPDFSHQNAPDDDGPYHKGIHPSPTSPEPGSLYAGGLPTPPNLKIHSSDSPPAFPSQSEWDSADTPISAPRDGREGSVPPIDQYVAPLQQAALRQVSEEHSLRDDVFGIDHEENTLPVAEPPTEPVQRVPDHFQGDPGEHVVDGPQPPNGSANYRDFLTQEDRRAQEQAEILRQDYGDPNIPTPREAKEQERAFYGNPRRSHISSTPSSNRSRMARVTMTTGSHGGAGKTSVTWVAANAAAIALRQSGVDSPVYLIETDYRNPKLASRIGSRANNRHLGLFADALFDMQRQGEASQANIVRAMLANTVSQDDTGLRILVAPYHDMGRYDAQKLKYAISTAVNVAARVSAHVYMDCGTLTAGNFDSLDEQLANLSHKAILVTDMGHISEAHRTAEILRHPGSKRISRDHGFVNIFMNKTRPENTDRAASEMHPYTVCGMWPRMDDLDVESSSNGWVNAAPAETKNYLLRATGFALTKMGYSDMAPAYGKGIINPQVSKPSLLKRLLRFG